MNKQIQIFRFRNLYINISISQYRSSRSPYDQGAADRYYGRKYRPSRIDFWGRERTDLTPQQIADYANGWNEEMDRKDWGVAC